MFLRRGLAVKILTNCSAPSALGLTRNHSLQGQALVKLAMNCQAAVEAYLKAYNKQGLASVWKTACERMQILATGGVKNYESTRFI